MVTLNPGDRVAYSATFCRAVGAYCGEIPAMRGVVVELRGCGIVVVRWDGVADEMRIHQANLASVGPNLAFAWGG